MDADLDFGLLSYRNGPALDAALSLAPGLFGAGRENDALEVVEDALARFGEHPALLSVAGHIWLARKELKHAQAFFQRALACDRKQAEVYVALAEVLVARGDTTRARLALQKATALAPPDRALEARLRQVQPPLSHVFSPFGPPLDSEGPQQAAPRGEIEKHPEKRSSVRPPRGASVPRAVPAPSVAPKSQHLGPISPSSSEAAHEGALPGSARQASTFSLSGSSSQPDAPKRKPLPVPPPSLRKDQMRAIPSVSDPNPPLQSAVPSIGTSMLDASADKPSTPIKDSALGASGDSDSQNAAGQMHVDEAWLEGSESARSVEHGPEAEKPADASAPKNIQLDTPRALDTVLGREKIPGLGSHLGDEDDVDEDSASTSLFVKQDLSGEGPQGLEWVHESEPDTVVGEALLDARADAGSGATADKGVNVEGSVAADPKKSTGPRRKISTSVPPPMVRVEAKSIASCLTPPPESLDLTVDVAGGSQSSDDSVTQVSPSSGEGQAPPRHARADGSNSESSENIEVPPQSSASMTWRRVALGTALIVVLAAMVFALVPRALHWKLTHYAHAVLREPARLADPPVGVNVPERVRAYLPGLQLVELEREALGAFEATSELELRQVVARLASKVADIRLRESVPDYFTGLVEAQVHWAHGRSNQAVTLLGGRIPDEAALSRLLQARLRFEAAYAFPELAPPEEGPGDLLALIGAASNWFSSSRCGERTNFSGSGLAFNRPDGEWQSMIRLCWGKARRPQAQALGFWAQVEALRATASGEAAQQAALSLTTKWPSRPWAALAPLRWLDGEDRGAFARKASAFLGELPDAWRVAAVEILLAGGDLQPAEDLIERLPAEQAGPLAVRHAWLSGGVPGAWLRAHPERLRADTFAILLQPQASDETDMPDTDTMRGSVANGDDRRLLWQRLGRVAYSAESLEACVDLQGLLVVEDAEAIPAFERSFWLAQLARSCGNVEVQKSAWRRTIELLPVHEALPGVRLRLWANLDALLAGYSWREDVPFSGDDSGVEDPELSSAVAWLSAVGELGDPSAPDASAAAALRDLGRAKMRPLPWLGMLTSLPALRVGISVRGMDPLESVLDAPQLLSDQAVALAIATEAMEGDASKAESWLRERAQLIAAEENEAQAVEAEDAIEPEPEGSEVALESSKESETQTQGEISEDADAPGAQVKRLTALTELGSAVAQAEIHYRAGMYTKAIKGLAEFDRVASSAGGAFVDALGSLVRGKAHLALARAKGVDAASGKVHLAAALAHLERSTEHPLMLPQAHFFLAETMVAASEKGAREHFRRYLELAPSGSYAERAQASLL